MNVEAPCTPPKTWFGRLILKIRLLLEKDDGETLTCQKCGNKLYID